MTTDKKCYPCPCCGYLVFKEPPGSYDICPICFWEDDSYQLDNPAVGGGPNHLSLIESQQNFLYIGACEERLLAHVRPPSDNDARDPGWRPIDVANDMFGTAKWQVLRGVPIEQRYYWRPNYWLVHVNTPRQRRVFRQYEKIAAFTSGRLLKFYAMYLRIVVIPAWKQGVSHKKTL